MKGTNGKNLASELLGMQHGASILSIYADFVTSCIAFARYPTLPVVTPAILFICFMLDAKIVY